MKWYAIVAFLLLVAGTPALAQSPISGSTPPWSQPSPIGPPLPVPPAIAVPVAPKSPAILQVPAGKPVYGFYITHGELVGADGYYPFDTGEYNLAAFAGNTRFFGSFAITLPTPADADPAYVSVPYRSFRNLCHKR
jgi:hypothetical protein